MEAAVKRYGFALEHACTSLRDDKNLLQIAVNYSGYSIRFASLRLRADPELLVAAVADKPGALKYASKHLKSGGLFKYARFRLTDHENFVVALGFVRFGSSSPSGCPLRKLNGHCESLLPEIASYVGIVRGKELKHLRLVASIK